MSFLFIVNIAHGPTPPLYRSHLCYIIPSGGWVYVLGFARFLIYKLSQCINIVIENLGFHSITLFMLTLSFIYHCIILKF